MTLEMDSELELGVGRDATAQPAGPPRRQRAMGALVVALAIGLVVALGAGVVAVSAHHFLRKMTPQQFFAAHHSQFTHLGADLRSGAVSTTSADAGSPLPSRYADLSVTRTVARIENGSGKTLAYVVPRRVTGTDPGAFVLVVGRKADLRVSLLGGSAVISQGVDVGDGWWYVEPE